MTPFFLLHSIIILINLLVLVFVIKRRERLRASFFLIINALSLIIWSSGMALGETLDNEPWAGALLYLSALLVPANLFYFAVTHPNAFSPIWKHRWMLFPVILPAIILSGLEDYRGPAQLFSLRYQLGTLAIEGTITRLVLLYSVGLLLASIIVLAIRYYNSEGPEKTLPKHLIASIFAPAIFGITFWLTTIEGTLYFIPSPSFLMAIIAQVSIVLVLRQEDLEAPGVLSRTAFYLTAIFLALLVVFLIIEVYTLETGTFLMTSTENLMAVLVVLTVLLVAKVGGLHNVFEHLIFARAQEYRKLFHETRQELRDARDRLRKAERLSVVGELSARVAHEIKNPLGPIKGYTQMMREKLEQEDDFRHQKVFLSYLDIIGEEIEAIDSRIRQLLNMAHQQQLNLEPTNVNRLVSRCADLLRLEISGMGDPPTGSQTIQVDTNLDMNLQLLNADTKRLEEAIFNIGRNALQATFSNKGGEIYLETLFAPGPDGEPGVRILIRDCGPGFPLDEIEDLFTPFFTKKEGGTGLGLAIVKSHVEAHGGTILINNHPSGGEVRVWIPNQAKVNPGATLPKAQLPKRKNKAEKVS